MHSGKFAVFLSIAAIIICCVVSAGCTTDTSPEFHLMNTEVSDSGASSYNHSLDNSNSKYYVINDFYRMKNSESLHIIPEFATIQQSTEFTCGPSCALMVLHHFGNDSYTEMELAEKLHTDPSIGTTVESMRDFFTDIGYTVESHTGTEEMFIDQDEFENYLSREIDAGIPVMVNWEDWGGHWQVIIGYDTCGTENSDDDVLILADPYDITDHYQDGYYTYPLARFFTLWKEGSCSGKDEPYIQPFVTAYPTQMK